MELYVRKRRGVADIKIDDELMLALWGWGWGWVCGTQIQLVQPPAGAPKGLRFLLFSLFHPFPPGSLELSVYYLSILPLSASSISSPRSYSEFYFRCITIAFFIAKSALFSGGLPLRDGDSLNSIYFLRFEIFCSFSPLHVFFSLREYDFVSFLQNCWVQNEIFQSRSTYGQFSRFIEEVACQRGCCSASSVSAASGTAD